MKKHGEELRKRTNKIIQRERNIKVYYLTSAYSLFRGMFHLLNAERHAFHIFSSTILRI